MDGFVRPYNQKVIFISSSIAIFLSHCRPAPENEKKHISLVAI